MASPANPSGPLTPPAEPSSQVPISQSNTQTTTQSTVEALLSQPLTSLTDDGSSKRPRDHRLIHLLLASHGVNAYQERVPLQLMDFAYRYTSSILSDALHIQNEGYDQAENQTQTKGRGAKNQNKSEEGDISLASLRMSIGSRMGYQFNTGLPKEFLKQLADERNRISLNTQARDGDKSGPVISGVKLPHERYCMTGTGWGLKEEWESEGEESVGDDNEDSIDLENAMQVDSGKEKGAEDEQDGDEDEDEDLGTMEDVFGPDDGGQANKDEDEQMQD